MPGAALDSGYLATKRHPPLLPPRLVDRPRLLDALDDAVRDSPVTMLRAPAGSGKTALLTAWARSDRPPGPVAWLSLNHTDGNRGRFWRQVFLALSEAGAGPALSHLAVPSPEAVERLLVSLVTALTDLDSPIVLVLDDLHEVADDQVMGDLAMLLRTPPPSLRLVIGTRRDPPVRLQRMRLAGALAEISAEQLVFTEEEALALFTASGVTLEAADAARLWSRTEGWAAGLALTALTLRTRPDATPFIEAFAGDVAPVADYLLEEVLADQPPLMRDFLLTTSVVNVVCGDLADALTGTTGSAVLLERLHHGGVLTTAMDDHREWYRYHGLLADLLRAVLRREEPEMVPILHRRAARWYADHDFPVTAARHALDAGDLTFLTEVTATRGAQLLARGEMGELADVLRQLPEATLEANPTFALALASAAIEVGAVRDATSWTEVALAHADRVPPQFEATFRTAAMVTRLFQARVAGDVEDALQAARAIISVDDDTPVESGTDLDAIALVNLGALELWTGEQEAATRELERGATIAAARSRWYLRVYALSHLAVQAVWTGDMPAATRRAQESLALCDDYGWGGTARAGMAKTVLSVVAMLEGRLDDAVALVDEAIVATAGGRELPLRANTELHRARLLRMRGRTHEALEIIAAVRRDLDGSPFLPPIAGVIQTEDALTHLAAGDRDRAVALLEESVAAGASGESPVALASIRLDEGDVQAALRLVGPWTGPDLGRQMASTHVRALIVAARAQRQLGDREAAFAALERALAIAAPQVRRLPFLEQPPEFADQLREHVGAGSAYAAFATDLHDRLPRGGQAPTADAVVHPREELSARELAVLRFLPTMLTNREIAEELMVSVNTVKTHLKQVYSKLGAHDRRDAVRRARERGLLR